MAKPKHRMLYENIGLSYRIASLPYEPHDAQKFFIGLISKADRDGRLNGDPKLLSKVIWPHCNYSEEEVTEWLDLMEAQKDDQTNYGLIERYEVNGRKYIWLPGWEIHQPWAYRKHETPSNIPPPPSAKEGLSPSKPKDDKKINPLPELKNISMTQGEYQKLIDKFGEQGTRERCEELSFAIESKGYKYKSHYFTILNWDRRNQDKEKASGTHKGSPRQVPKAFEYKQPDEY